MTRPFLPLFQAGFGGIGAVDRVVNTPAAVSQWENFTSTNIGIPVEADSRHPTCYFIGDVSPINDDTVNYLGYDLMADDYSRVAISDLLNVTTAEVVDAASQYVSITTIFTYGVQTSGKVPEHTFGW